MSDADRKRDTQRGLMQRRKALDGSIDIPQPRNMDRRLEAESSMFLWGRTYFSEVWPNIKPWMSCVSAPAHEDWCKIIEEAMRYGGTFAVAAPRGGAKTTICAQLGAMFGVFSGLVRFPLVVAASEKKAGHIIGEIRNQLLWNVTLSEDYPELCIPCHHAAARSKLPRQVYYNGESIRMVWTNEYICLPSIPGRQVTGSGAIFAGLGILGPIRGFKIDNQRPEMTLLDDPQNSKDSRSETLQANIEEIILQDIGGLAESGIRGTCAALMTVIRRYDIAYKMTHPEEYPEFKSWFGRCMRALEPMPANMDLWNEWKALRGKDNDRTNREAHRFYVEHRVDMDAGPDGEPVKEFWPGKYDMRLGPDGEPLQISSLENCMEIWADKGEKAFYAEYQNDPIEVLPGFGLTTKRVSGQLSGYPAMIVPDNVVAIGRGVDVRMTEIHYVTIALTADGRYMILDHADERLGIEKGEGKKLVGTRIREKLEEIDEIEQNGIYYSDDGKSIFHVGMTNIDAGYRPDIVYPFCKARSSRFRPVRGDSSVSGKEKYHAPTTRKGVISREHWFGKRPRPQAPVVWHLDVDWAKGKIHEGFIADPMSAGAILLYGNDPKAHARYANHIVKSEQFDDATHKWKLNQSYPYNHFLDATGYAIFAILMQGAKSFTIESASAPDLQQQNIQRPTVRSREEIEALYAV